MKKLLRPGLAAGLIIGVLALAGCIPGQPPADGGEPQPFNWTILIIMGGLFVLMYFMTIRPQRKRQQQQQQMIRELRKGDKVITAGGIYGQVESISEDSVIIRVESGATMRVAKGSVALIKEQK